MHDIIIVGGGPAGAMAGKYLSKSGKNVLLIQKDFSYKKPCGGGLRMDAFDEFDISKSLVKNVVDKIILETQKKSIEVDISHVPLAVVDRVEFDQSLRDDAINAGTTIIEGKVVDLKVSTSKVIVYAFVEGKSVSYESHYLIAADGVLSNVRKKIRKEEVPKRLTYYSDIDTLVTQNCHFYFGSTFTHKAYAWRFPYGHGSDVGTVSKQNTQGYIYSLFKFLGISSKEKIRGYDIPIWEKPLFNEGRIFYVGDAAGQVLPFTYEGIYYAMSSAKILAEVLIDDVDIIEYENRWNALYLQKFKALKNAQKIFLSNDIMIALMMKILGNIKIQEKLLDIWRGKKKLVIDRHFFYRIFVHVVKK